MACAFPRINGVDHITITPGAGDDLEWCARLTASNEPWITLRRDLDQCREAIHRPGYTILLAREGGAPLGFIRLHPCGVAGSPYIASVAVADEARGRGIGTLLVRHVEELSASSARHIFLCVSSFNARARGLYERLGYKAVGELKDYIIDGASEILMMKRLR